MTLKMKHSASVHIKISTEEYSASPSSFCSPQTLPGAFVGKVLSFRCMGTVGPLFLKKAELQNGVCWKGHSGPENVIFRVLTKQVSNDFFIFCLAIHTCKIAWYSSTSAGSKASWFCDSISRCSCFPMKFFQALQPSKQQAPCSRF